MEDPLPENISGQKTANWNVNLDIDIGTLAVGLGFLALAWVAWQLVGPSEETSRDRGEEIEVEGVGVLE